MTSNEKLLREALKQAHTFIKGRMADLSEWAECDQAHAVQVELKIREALSTEKTK